MKANELRIGNWIEKDGKQYAATGLTIFCVGNNHKPIPLTEEWLVKFGINNVSVTRIKCYQTKFRCYNITIEDNIFKFWVADCDDCGFALDIKYVHQLQNLYFALTGEELILKESTN